MHVTVRHVTVQRVEQRLCFLHGLVVFGVRVGFDGDAAARADPVQARLVTSPDVRRAADQNAQIAAAIGGRESRCTRREATVHTGR